MQRLVKPLCFSCEHYRPWQDGPPGTRKAFCAAFPDGIPDEILKELYDHREPLGDETVLFSPKEGVSEEDVIAWARDAAQLQKDLFELDMERDAV